MNILTISLDRKLFDVNSDVSKRMVACGQIADSWHIVVFNVKNNKQSFEASNLAENVFVYPINWSESRQKYESPHPLGHGHSRTANPCPSI